MVVPGNRKWAVELSTPLALKDYLIQTVMNSVQIPWEFPCVLGPIVSQQRGKREVRTGSSHEWNEAWETKQKSVHSEGYGRNLAVGTTFNLLEVWCLHSVSVSWYAKALVCSCNSYSVDQMRQGSYRKERRKLPENSLVTEKSHLRGGRISSISWGTPVTPRGYVEGNQW